MTGVASVCSLTFECEFGRHALSGSASSLYGLYGSIRLGMRTVISVHAIQTPPSLTEFESSLPCWFFISPRSLS